jgi:hypothetical protein
MQAKGILVRAVLGPVKLVVAALTTVFMAAHLIAVVGAHYTRAFGKMLDTTGTKNDGDKSAPCNHDIRDRFPPEGYWKCRNCEKWGGL